MSIELKIKSKSLAVEAQIIRAEELKLRGHARSRTARQLPADKLYRSFNSLQRHRIDVVRTEARATFLARAFLNGKPRSAVEAKPIESHNRAFKIAKKYSTDPITEARFNAWLQA